LETGSEAVGAEGVKEGGSGVEMGIVGAAFAYCTEEGFAVDGEEGIAEPVVASVLQARR
jgi:hypothetical protein